MQWCNSFRPLEALQCYSCKSSASNENDANIRCLENSILEDCDDFYTYYYEVEDQDILSYEYYYYDKTDKSTKETSKEKAPPDQRKNKGRQRKREGGRRRQTPRDKDGGDATKNAPRGKREISSENKELKPLADVTPGKTAGDQYDELEKEDYYDYTSFTDDYNYTFPDYNPSPTGDTEEQEAGEEEDKKSKEENNGVSKATPTLPKDPEVCVEGKLF